MLLSQKWTGAIAQGAVLTMLSAMFANQVGQANVVCHAPTPALFDS